ncbi:MAG: ABC transporter permease [Vicinamibacterales bacterium]
MIPLQDLRFAIRVLMKHRGFSAVALLTLALGIGANTSIFTLVNATLLKRLPVRAPGELVVLERSGRVEASPRFSWPMFERLRAALPADAALLAMTPTTRVNVRGDGDLLEIAEAQLVSGEFFPVLGISASAGRLLARSDNVTEGAHPVVVLSDAYWTRRFGRDPSAVGRTLVVNGRAYAVVGVAPAGFFGTTIGSAPDLWLPVMMQTPLRYSGNASVDNADSSQPWIPQDGVQWLQVMARLPAGGRDAAIVRLSTAFAQGLAERADTFGDPDVRARFLAQRLIVEAGDHGTGELRSRIGAPLWILMAMVGVVLLVACANVANLLMARAAGRRRELAIRVSIGASRSRLVRQLLIESLLLAAGGGGLGLLVAQWGVAGLVALVSTGPQAVPVDVAPDVRVLLFTTIVAVGAGLAFGLAPALVTTRVDLSTALKPNADATVRSGRSSLPLGRVFIAVQVALSVLLLVGAGLFSRTVEKLNAIDAGFNRQQLINVRIDPRSAGYSRDDLPALYRRLIERIGAVPGVKAVNVSLCGLLNTCRRTSGIAIPGYTRGPDDDMDVQVNVIGPRYLSMVGMTLVAGREIAEGDREGTVKVAVVNERMARRFFGEASPIGRRFGFDEPDEFEIVGLVRDAHLNDLREDIPPVAFVAAFQNVDFLRVIDIRAEGEPASLIASIRRAIAEAEPSLPIIDATTLTQQVDRSLANERTLAILTGTFGLIALLLACVGLYGVVSYDIGRRTNELGVRLALGADRTTVIGMVMGETMRVVGIGVAAGLVAALGAGRAVSRLLYGLAPHDPTTLAVAIVLLIATAAVAAFVPAYRASRVDPTHALRNG